MRERQGRNGKRIDPPSPPAEQVSQPETGQAESSAADDDPAAARVATSASRGAQPAIAVATPSSQEPTATGDGIDRSLSPVAVPAEPLGDALLDDDALSGAGNHGVARLIVGRVSARLARYPALARPAYWARAAIGDAVACSLLIGLTLAFYRSLIGSSRVMADAGLFGQTYPYRQFLAGALREGRIPLWNPYLFTGVPFLADSRAGALYPPNIVLRWLDAPAAVAFSIVAHALVAVLGMYAFCRFALGSRVPAAVAGAAVFSLGGFMAANTVEPNVVEAAAWAPLALLGADIAVRRRFSPGVALGALALALSFLAGQPHITALVGGATLLLLVVRGLPLTMAFTQSRSPAMRLVGASAARALTAAVLICVLALAVAAAQVLPTCELYRLSPRAGGLSYSESTTGTLPARDVVRALLPGFTDNPSPGFTAHLGLIALAVALVGLRRRSFACGFGWLLIVLGLAEATAITPLHRLLVNFFPGGYPFDQPARALLLVALGGGCAVAAGVEALWPRSAPSWTILRLRPPAPFPRHGIPAALAGAVALLLLVWRPSIDLPRASAVEIWIGLAIVALDIALILPLLRPRRWVAGVVVAAIAGELLLAGIDLPFTRLTDAAAYETPAAPTELLGTTGVPPRIVRPPGIAATDTPVDAGLERYTDARAGRDQFAPDTGMLEGVNTVDGRVSALLPGRALLDALRSGVSDPIAGVLSGSVIDRLGPRLAAPFRVGSAPAAIAGGPFRFPPTTPRTLGPGGELEVVIDTRRPATMLGLLATSSALPGRGEPIADVVLTDSDGVDRRRVLLAGVDLLQTDAAPAEQVVEVGEDVRAVVASQPLGRPAVFIRLHLRNLSPSATVVIHGLALLDERSGDTIPIALPERLAPLAGARPPVLIDSTALPRASLSRDLLVDEESGAALSRALDAPLTTVVLDRAPRFTMENTTPTPSDSVRIAEYSAEHVRIVVGARAPAVLVLRDSWYPGWRVYVDGHRAEMLRADGLFRGVAVPAGDHLVSFDYRPAGMTRGALISAAALACALVLCLAPLSRPR